MNAKTQNVDKDKDKRRLLYKDKDTCRICKKKYKAKDYIGKDADYIRKDLKETDFINTKTKTVKTK